jgi:hypothetical protein
MKAVLHGFCLALFALFLSQCETIDSGMAGSSGSVTVAGTMFYPDEKGMTYRVPAGAQIIGAGGTDCVFIIESGGGALGQWKQLPGEKWRAFPRFRPSGDELHGELRGRRVDRTGADGDGDDICRFVSGSEGADRGLGRIGSLTLVATPGTWPRTWPRT